MTEAEQEIIGLLERILLRLESIDDTCDTLGGIN